LRRLKEIEHRLSLATPTTGTIEMRGHPAGGWDIEGPDAGDRGQFDLEDDARFHAGAQGDIRWLLARVRELDAGLRAVELDLALLLKYEPDLSDESQTMIGRALDNARSALAGES
jgi:hypothetical protein